MPLIAVDAKLPIVPVDKLVAGRLFGEIIPLMAVDAKLPTVWLDKLTAIFTRFPLASLPTFPNTRFLTVALPADRLYVTISPPPPA
jgi:hypothetical protein